MAIIWAIGAAIVAVGYSYQQAKKAQREAKKQADAMAGVLITKDSTIESVPVIYGERRVGGTRVFIETKNGSEGKHEYLYMAIVLSEGEVEEIDLDTIHFDDKPLAQYGLYPPVNDVFDRYTNEDLGRLAGDGVKVYDSRDANKEMFRVEGFIGTDFQAASTILTEAPSWTADHRLQGVAYLAIRLKWDEDVFSGVPSVSVVVRGKKVYDARKDSTSSYYNASLGVSSHRSNDVATWEYSNNPALCLRDYLTNARYGKALPESSINDDYFYSAADDIDSFEVTPYSGGSNIKLFQLNAVIDTAEEIFKNVERILIATRGFFPFSNGKYGLTIDQAKSSVLTINSDIIIGGIKVKGPQKEDRFNIVEIKYPNKNLNYNVDTAIWPDPQSDLKTSFSDGQGDYLTEAELYAQFVEEDNGFELKDDVDLEYVTNYYAARDMARIFCLRSRYNMAVEVQCSSKAIDLMIGDVVSVEHPTVGWSAGNGKLFQVEGVTLREDGTVDLLLLEYTSSIYAYDPANEEVAYVDSDLPDPFLISAPTNVGATSQSALLEDGTLLPRLGVTWTASEDKFVSTYEVGYKLTGTTEYSIVKSTGGSALIEGIKTGTYDVAVRSVNSMGIKSAWVTKATSTDISADTTAPDAPTSVTATGGVKSIELTWDNPEGVDNADFKHVEIYYTTDTNFTPTNWTPQDDGTASLAKVDGESFILGGLTAGDQYKFWLRSVDFTGNKSAYASRAEAVGTAIATPAGDIDVSNINTSDLNNDAGFVDADGAAAAAPVQSVAGLTGSVLVADIITEGALIVSGDNISDLTNDAGYTTFDANDVEAAIANNVTVIDGAKITTGTVAAARLDVAGLINTQKLAVNYELDLNSSGVKTVTITDYSISVNGANGWDTDVYSTQSYKGKCIARGTIKVKNAYYMFGINTDPLANDSYSSLDFSVYCDYGTLRIYESGTDRGTFGSLAIGDTLEVIYADGYVKYYQNGTEKRSVAVSGDPEFYFDSSFYSGGNVVYVEDVYFGQGGVAITPDAIYQGAGHWNNADTGFYLDKDGRFSLDNKLSFDPSSDTLRVDGLIEAVNLTVTGEAKFANVTADNVKVGSITYDMLSGEVKNAFQADIAVSTGGTVGDFQEDSGIIPSTVDLPVFSHGSKPVEITLTASKTGYHYVDYTTAQRTATYTVQRATDAAFTANLQTIGTGSIIVSAYDISGYYGGSSTVFYHAVNFSVLITDDPSLGDYYYRVTFSAGSAFSDSDIQVTANLAANEAASGVTSSGGNADTLDNLDSTKFMRTDENTGTTGDLQVGGSLSVTGDLNITGNINSYNVTDLDVSDTSITLNAGGAALTAAGAGIYIEKAVDASTDASITWDGATNRDYFTFSHPITAYGAGGFLSGELEHSTPFVAKLGGDSTFLGAINQYGYQTFAINVLSSTNSSTDRGDIVFYSRKGGTWKENLRLANDDVAIAGDLSVTGTLSASGYNNSNWDTAYGWGDHDGLYLPIGGGTLTGSLVFSSYDTPNAIKMGDDTNWCFGSSHGTADEYFMQVKYYSLGTDNRGFRVYDTRNSSVDMLVNDLGLSANAFKVSGTTVVDSSKVGYLSKAKIGTLSGDLDGQLHVQADTTSTVYISAKKTYGVGTGTAERARLVLSINEDDGSLSAAQREFLVIDAGTTGETSSANGAATFSVRSSGTPSTNFSMFSTYNRSDKDLYMEAGKLLYASSGGFYNGRNNWYSLNEAGTGYDTVFTNNDGNHYFNSIGGYRVGGTAVIDSSRNLTNIGNLTLSSQAAINFYGSGTDTYTQGAFYAYTNNFGFEAPLTSNSSTASHVPIFLTWRGGFGSQGGLKLGDGYGQFGDTAYTSGQTTDVYITGDQVGNDDWFARLIFRNSDQSGGSTSSIRGGRETDNYGTNLQFYVNGAGGSAGDGSEKARLYSTGVFSAIGGFAVSGTAVIDSSRNLKVVKANASSGAYTMLNYTLMLGDTTTNYVHGETWSTSTDAGILANCSDNWEMIIHDSGHALVSPFCYRGGATRYFEMGRGVQSSAWGTTPYIFRDYVATDKYFKATDSSTSIDVDATANTVYLGRVRDGSGWEVNGIGGKSNSIGRTWGIGTGISSNTLYFGIGNNSADNSLSTWLKVDTGKKIEFQHGADNVIIGNGVTGDARLSFVGNNDFCGIGFNRDVSDGTIFDSGTGAYQLHLQDNLLHIEIYNSSGTTLHGEAWSLDSSANNKVVGNFNTTTGGYQINGTTVIDSSRNLTNIGTITASGTIQTTGGNIEIGTYSTTATGSLLLNGSTANKQAKLMCTNGNLHMDSHAGHGMYLNYYSNTGSIIFMQNKGKIDSSGNFTAVGDITAYGTVSDIRQKENIEILSDAIAKIKKLDGVTFNYIGNKEPMTGVIAQQVKEVLPEAVYEHTDIEGNEMYAVRHGNMVGLLIEGMKEQQKEIDELKALVKQLLEK